MKETKHITKLFNDIYDGEPWIDINLLGTIKKLSAKQAAKKVSPKYNSIWEIVNHIIKWRVHILKRIQGVQLYVTGNNYFEKITDKSEAAWEDTLKQLEVSQEEWVSFLKKFNEKDLYKVNPNNGMTHYEHIHGIIQHDAYHLGQIVMLAKTV